jgi:ElaA protein
MSQKKISLNWHLKTFEELSNHELYEVLALRSEVFVVEQDCVYQDMDFRDDKAWHLLGKTAEGKLIAYTRLFCLNEYYEGFTSIGRVITHGDFRKHGFGKELMQTSIEKCNTLFGEHPIKIGAQKYLTEFYSSLGFQEIGEDYMEDGIPHCIMIKP